MMLQLPVGIRPKRVTEGPGGQWAFAGSARLSSCTKWERENFPVSKCCIKLVSKNGKRRHAHLTPKLPVYLQLLG